MARINGAVTDEVGTVLAELPDVTIVNTEHGYRWAGKAKIVPNKTFPPSVETMMTTPYFLSLKDGRFAKIKIIRFSSSMFGGTVLEFDGGSRLEAPKPGTVAALKPLSNPPAKPATAPANAPDPQSQIGKIIIPNKSNDKPASITNTPIPATSNSTSTPNSTTTSSTGKPPTTAPVKHASLGGFQPPPPTGGPTKLTSSGVRPLSMTGTPAGPPAGAAQQPKPPTSSGLTTQSSTGVPIPTQATTKPPTAPGLTSSSTSSPQPGAFTKPLSTPGFKTVSSSGIPLQPGSAPPAVKPRSITGFSPAIGPAKPRSITGMTLPGDQAPESSSSFTTPEPAPSPQAAPAPTPPPAARPSGPITRPALTPQSGAGLAPPAAKPQSISGIRLPGVTPSASSAPKHPSISGMNPSLHVSHHNPPPPEASTSNPDAAPAPGAPAKPPTAPGVVHASSLSFRAPPKINPHQPHTHPTPPADSKK